ncbi:MAG: NAD-dependent deacylase [Desulfobacterales bacterium]|nr:NAD-dependent deacylase [Desulfobacterales bacterium]
MIDQYIKAAEIIRSAKNVVALTGAGISVESGIPPFRGKGGLWEKIDAEKYAHIDTFMKDPATVWNVLLKDLKDVLDKAVPNDGHKGLAKLEAMGKLTTVITQNLDGLHQAAGNSDVIEFHGNFASQRCIECGHQCPTKDVDMSQMPPRCKCGGIYRPECIFYGEMIPEDNLERSIAAASGCDVMLVIGTSAIVHPAAMMPAVSKQNNATVIEINAEATTLSNHISDLSIYGSAGDIMNGIVRYMTQ